MTDDLKRTFVKALSAYGVPQEPLQVYTSNSYRRIGLTSTYREVVYACRQQSDGHLDIAGTEILEAMVAAFNWALAERASPAVDADAWRPIETAPKDGTPILGYNPKWAEPADRYEVIHWRGWAWNRDDDEFTQWRPLPGAPE